MTEIISSDAYEFVDYVAPPPTRVPPPAKYKLWLLVFVLVYFAEWFSMEAGFLPWIMSWGFLSFNASFFLMLSITVFCLTYATLDLVVVVLTLKVAGKSYGLEPWFKQPRAQFTNKGNFFVALFATIVGILEDGFAMFNPPEVYASTPPPAERTDYECDDENCEVVLKIEHRIDPSRLKDYGAWQQKIAKAVKKQKGYKRTEMSEGWEQEGWDEEACRKKEDESKHDGEDGALHVVYVTFSAVDYINEWMASPKRKRLVKELGPLLLKPDVFQVQRDRALPDAFTELVTLQGESVPTLRPKKWKVWWLTSIGLFFSLIWTQKSLPWYFDTYGISEFHPRVEALISVFINTFLNSYVMTPVLLFLFSSWMKRRDGEDDKIEPWRTLNDGVRRVWLKVLMTFALYGGCIIAWAVKG